MIIQPELDEEQRELISELFFERIVPKLRKLHARNGALSCKFAGDQFEHWILYFREAGDEFLITDFEYDPDARELDLDI